MASVMLPAGSFTSALKFFALGVGRLPEGRIRVLKTTSTSSVSPSAVSLSVLVVTIESPIMGTSVL